MLENIRIAGGARFDLKRAFEWYEEREPGLGANFLKRFEEVLLRIAREPLSFPSRFEVFRRGLLLSFPYAIFFHLKAERAIIIGVIHTSREPEGIERMLKRRI